MGGECKILGQEDGRQDAETVCNTESLATFS
jgi:hypothetical protein